MTVDELVAFGHYNGNRISFNDCHGEDTSPAVNLVGCHLNKRVRDVFSACE